MAAQSLLVGRSRAFSQLFAALEHALAGKRQVVFVTGGAGLGKSALVERFLRDVAAQRLAVVAWGQCLEQHGSREAFLPVLDAIGRLGLSAKGAPLRPVLERHAPLWLAQIPALLGPGEGEALARSLLGASQDRMLREMAGALEALSREMALVLFLEDLHWSDPSSLDLLTLIARRIEPARLLLIVTTRTPEQIEPGHPLRGVHQDLLARGRCQQIALEMLSEVEVGEYLRARLDASLLDPSLSAWIYRRSEGHPLFLVNLVDYLLQRGWLRREEGSHPGLGGWHLAVAEADRERAVPEGLAALIERQLAGVSIEAREVLEAASVVGQYFGAVTVSAGLGLAVDDVDRQLEALARTARLIVEDGVEDWPDGQLGGRYRFLHAFYRDAVLNRMTAARRVRLHRRVGQAKENAWGARSREIAGELAQHFAEGHHAPRAIACALDAGVMAQARGAHREAAGHLQVGLGLVSSLPAEGAHRERSEISLQTALGAALMSSHGYSAPEVVAAFERALELTSRLPATESGSLELAPVLGGLVSFYHARAQLGTARALAEQLLALAATVRDDLVECQAQILLGSVLHSSGELLPALECFAKGLERYDPAHHIRHVSAYGGADPGVNLLQWTALTLWQLGYAERASLASEWVGTLAERLGHPFSLTWSLVGRALIRNFRGEYEAARELVEAACRRAEDEKFPFLIGFANVARAGILLHLAPPPEVVREAEHALALHVATGACVACGSSYGQLAAAHARAGDLGAALARAEQAIALVEKQEEHLYRPELERLRGLLLRGLGRPAEEAEACFRSAHERARRMGSLVWQLRAAVELARLLNARGDRAEAIDLLARTAAVDDHELGAKDLAALRELLTQWQVPAETLARALSSTPRPPRELLERVERAGRAAAERARAAERATRADSSPAEAPGPETDAASGPARPVAPARNAEAERGRALLRREGDYWTLVFAGETCRLQHTQGLGHLARLLAAPGQSFSALELVAAAEGLATATMRGMSADLPPIASAPYGDTGELLDSKARREYERRLRDLREDIEEAEARNDSGHAERAREEMERLLEELSRATRLGGRSRTGGSAAERARVNVTRAIRGALRRIGEHHAAAGRHLQSSVRTGTHCSYAPSGDSTPGWEL